MGQENQTKAYEVPNVLCMAMEWIDCTIEVDVKFSMPYTDRNAFRPLQNYRLVFYPKSQGTEPRGWQPIETPQRMAQRFLCGRVTQSIHRATRHHGGRRVIGNGRSLARHVQSHPTQSDPSQDGLLMSMRVKSYNAKASLHTGCRFQRDQQPRIPND